MDECFQAAFIWSNWSLAKGLASYCKAETTFTFYFFILTLSNAFLGIDNREKKSESGFSFAIASQPFVWVCWRALSFSSAYNRRGCYTLAAVLHKPRLLLNMLNIRQSDIFGGCDIFRLLRWHCIIGRVKNEEVGQRARERATDYCLVAQEQAGRMYVVPGGRWYVVYLCHPDDL